GMPRAVVQALNEAFAEALAQPAIKDKLLQAGFSPRSSSADSLSALAASEYERLGKVARAAKMTLE
ncbi:MAG TPA: tripartite tricarboxylate transporter substrate-binding protein, partial [Polaromonas sp.]